MASIYRISIPSIQSTTIIQDSKSQDDEIYSRYTDNITYPNITTYNKLDNRCILVLPANTTIMPSEPYRYIATKNYSGLIDSTIRILTNDNISDKTKKSLLTIKGNDQEIIPINDLFTTFPKQVLIFIGVVDVYCTPRLRDEIYKVNNINDTLTFSLLDNEDKIKMLIRYILEFSTVTLNEKVKLLTNDYKARFDISVELKTNNYAGVKIFFELVLYSDLATKDKLQILLVQNKQGETLIDNILSASSLTVMDEIITMIAHSSLSDNEKSILISSKFNKLSNWIYRESNKLSAKAKENIQNYTEIISNHKLLSSNLKNDLLTPLDDKAKLPLITSLSNIANIAEIIRAVHITKLLRSGRKISYIDCSTMFGYFSKGIHVNRNNCISAHTRQNATLGNKRVIVCKYLVCRHIANAFACAKKKFAFLNEVSNPATMAAYQLFQEDDYIKKLSQIKKSVFIFHYKELGTVLKSLVANNWGRENHEERFIYNTGYHDMVIGIKNTTNGKVAKIFLYDPNKTGKYFNIMIYNPEDAAKLTLEDFHYNNILEEYRVDKYSKGYKNYHSIYTITDAKIDTCETNVIGNITTPEVAKYLMLHKRFIKLTKEQLQVIIQKSTLKDIRFMFTVGFECYLAESIKYLVNSILDSDIEITKKINFLMSENNQVNTKYLIACAENSVECIAAYFETIVNSNQLSEEQKIHILQGIESHNGIYAAFTYDSQDAISYQAKTIIKSNLSLDTKKKLLECKSKFSIKVGCDMLLPISGKSVKIFFDIIDKYALSELKNEIHKAYNLTNKGQENLHQAIITQNIDDIEKQISISFPQKKQKPKLSCIIENMLVHKQCLEQTYFGYTDIVKFLTNFLANNNIKENEKQRILLQETQNLFGGQDLVENTQIHQLILKFFRTILTNDNLTDIQKVRLLLNNEYQKSLIDKILTRTKHTIEATEVLNDIITLTINYDLDTPKQVTTVSLIYTKLYKIFTADNILQQQNNLTAIVTFIEIILTSNLPNEIKIEALTIKDSNQEIIPINKFFIYFPEGLLTITNIIHKYSSFDIAYQICKLNNIVPNINLTITDDPNKIEVLTKYILTHKGLSTIKKVNILTVEYQATDNFPQELENNNYRVPIAFLQAVLDSDVEEKTKLQILFSKNKTGKTLVDNIFLNGKQSVIAKFTTIVENSSLTIDSIRKILYTRFNTVPQQCVFFHVDYFTQALSCLIDINIKDSNFNREKLFYLIHTHVIPIDISFINNRKQIAISVYPNDITRNHITIITKPSDIVNLREILGSSNEDMYEAILAHKEAMLCTLRTATENTCETIIIGNLSPRLVSLITKYGHIKNTPENIRDKMFADFTIEDIRNILLTAFKNKHFNSADYIIKYMLKNKELNENLVILTNIENEIKNQYTSIYKNDNEGYFISFYRLIVHSDLSEENKITILKDSNSSRSFISIAYSLNDCHTVTNISQLVLQSSLSAETKQNLLNIENISNVQVKLPESVQTFYDDEMGK